AADTIAVGHGRANLRGRRVIEFKCGVEETVVVRDVADASDLRFDVVARVRLVPAIDARRALPGVLGKIAVDGDRTGQPRDPNLLARQRSLGASGSCGRHQTQTRQRKTPSLGAHETSLT